MLCDVVTAFAFKHSCSVSFPAVIIILSDVYTWGCFLGVVLLSLNVSQFGSGALWVFSCLGLVPLRHRIARGSRSHLGRRFDVRQLIHATTFCVGEFFSTFWE